MTDSAPQGVIQLVDGENDVTAMALFKGCQMPGRAQGDDGRPHGTDDVGPGHPGGLMPVNGLAGEVVLDHQSTDRFGLLV